LRAVTSRRARIAGSRAAAFALAATLGAPAAAETSTPNPEAVRLAWSRAPEAEACPDATVIESDVTARLGESPFRAGASDVIDVHVTRERGEWSALIEDRPNGGPPSGSRVVTSAAESCDSLALAVGLAIALMIRARAASEPVEAPKPAVLIVPAPVTPPRALPPEPRAGERHVALFASAVGAVGILPHFAFGASVTGHVPLGERVSFGAGLTFLPEQPLDDASGEYAFGATFGEFAGCYGTTPSRVRLAVCAAALVGALHVVVSDPVPLEPGARFWGGAALGLAGDFTLTAPIHLLVVADGIVRFTRHSYVVESGDTPETVFTEPRVAARFGLGLGVEL
jgi:hypothetical protein